MSSCSMENVRHVNPMKEIFLPEKNDPLDPRNLNSNKNQGLSKQFLL